MMLSDEEISEIVGLFVSSVQDNGMRHAQKWLKRLDDRREERVCGIDTSSIVKGHKVTLSIEDMTVSAEMDSGIPYSKRTTIGVLFGDMEDFGTIRNVASAASNFLYRDKATEYTMLSIFAAIASKTRPFEFTIEGA